MLKTTVISLDDVVRAGHEMIDKAAEQLRRKSSPERARNVLPDDVDAVWLLIAPTHLVVWSVADQRWTNLIFTATSAPGLALPGADDGVDFLIAVDGEFHRQIGNSAPSPYAFKIVADRADDQAAQ